MKNIWLIGASEGIGRALAIKLNEKGHKLALSARSKERLEELNLQLKQKHITVPLDVLDEAAIKTSFKLVKENFTNIDIVIYCAGYYKPMSADNMDLPEIQKMIDINFTGALKLVERILPDFISRKSGHIALVGSIAGYRGLPSAIGYGASKSALIHFAENLAIDLAKYNIKVQIINPGFVKTRLTDMNKFHMPFMISPEKAADYIIAGLESNNFECNFPWFFANLLKFLSKLPYWLYFKIMKSK